MDWNFTQEFCEIFLSYLCIHSLNTPSRTYLSYVPVYFQTSSKMSDSGGGPVLPHCRTAQINRLRLYLTGVPAAAAPPLLFTYGLAATGSYGSLTSAPIGAWKPDFPPV